ncbi:hypothetical protein PIB30_090702 [Stylosanthes scabra]|uniref:Uncharacterized protein n=1 Tax=Stylosanthes scabra TaxID=79078 RepID=A0ABU6YX50_9FABA|nr:hypothetical protein [Stylosanthes scabra]
MGGTELILMLLTLRPCQQHGDLNDTNSIWCKLHYCLNHIDSSLRVRERLRWQGVWWLIVDYHLTGVQSFIITSWWRVHGRIGPKMRRAPTSGLIISPPLSIVLLIVGWYHGAFKEVMSRSHCIVLLQLGTFVCVM